MAVLVAGAGGCARIEAGKTAGYHTVVECGSRDTATAQKRFESASKLLAQCDVEGAEQLLHQALLADVSFGPAHNTLGKIYFDQKKYYLAAWEFEYANRVMPHRGEPLNNLGLVYEAVDQTDRAVFFYEQAIEGWPTNAEFLGNYIRARYRRGDRTSDLRPLLENLVMLDDRTDWVDWAKGLLLTGNIDEPRTIDVFVESPEGGAGALNYNIGDSPQSAIGSAPMLNFEELDSGIESSRRRVEPNTLPAPLQPIPRDSSSDSFSN
ncbi:MAG: hypothetical protein AAF456_17990 [Planctomycetota bacterium]